MGMMETCSMFALAIHTLSRLSRILAAVLLAFAVFCNGKALCRSLLEKTNVNRFTWST